MRGRLTGQSREITPCLEQGYHAKLESAGMLSLYSFGLAVGNSLPVDLRAIRKYVGFIRSF